jgi:hypothetical protein
MLGMFCAAGCIPAPVLRPRDGGASEASTDVSAATLDVVDASAGTDATDVVDAETLEVPRLTRPLSFAVVGTVLPELRWVLSERATGAQVQVCDDSACTRGVQTVDAQGNLVRLTAPLSYRAYFWRVRARYGERYSAWSRTWEFLVQGNASAMVSWYGFTDFDRDGTADIVVGAPGANGGRGAVLLYRGKDAPGPEPQRTLEVSDRTVSAFGTALCASGDYNGDGYVDIAAFAQQQGRARIIVLSETDDAVLRMGAVLQTERGGFEADQNLRHGGDLNGDGYADLVVGPVRNRLAAGELNVYLGGASGLDDGRMIIVRASDTPTATFGAAVVPFGDRDGDAFDDIVGSDVREAVEAGPLRLIRGRSNFVSQAVEVFALPPSAVPGVGERGASVGDVDEDGRADFVMSGREGLGALFTSTGNANSLRESVLRPGDFACLKFGRAYGGGFDVNGDHRADVLARCEFESGRHEVVVLASSTSSLRRLPLTIRRGQEPSASFAMDVFSPGDFDRDGFADVVVTTPTSDDRPTELSVMFGSNEAVVARQLRLILPMGVGVRDRLALPR